MEINTRHTLINGDSRNLSLMPDKSVHLIITSPPYWQLKDYGNDRQIGFHDSYESYINNLNMVWSECYRVLHGRPIRPVRLLRKIQGYTYKDRDHPFLRIYRDGLHGCRNLAKTNHDEYYRRRFYNGQLSISTQRYFKNRL